MTALNDSEIDAVIRRVLRELTETDGQTVIGGGAEPSAPGRDPLVATGRNGLFATVDEAVTAARAGQRELAKGGVGLRKRCIEAVRACGLQHADTLARAAHEETGLGRYRDKIGKNEFAATRSLGTEDLEVVAFSGEHGLTVEDWVPWGLVASITPTNSPSAFMINHGITMIAGGNAVAFNCHPGCKWTSMRTVELMNQAVVAAGGPDNLMTGVVVPSLETARALVTHEGVDMLCITGGAALVRDAFGTGKRVIAAGPGVPVAVLDETADASYAAAEIFRGASYENTILCIAEKAVVAAEAVYGSLLASLADLPVRILTAGELDAVFQTAIDMSRPEYPTTRREFVGRDAETLLAAAGVESRKPVGLLVAEVDRSHPLFTMEQFCPLLPIVRARNGDEAIDLGVEVEGRNRHTAMIYSHHGPNIERFAREASTVVTVVNGCSLRGLGIDGKGYPGFAIGTVTGEGITGPRHFVQRRRIARIGAF